MQTITEALAELATIDKRLAKKRSELPNYVARLEAMRDPLEKSGGSAKYLAQESQSFRDLLERKIELRAAIAASNAATELHLDDEVRSVADWLVWKRECYQPHKELLTSLLNSVRNARAHQQKEGVALVRVGEQAKPEDVVVNLDERELIHALEWLEEKFGRLDGLLSLKNATTTI